MPLTSLELRGRVAHFTSQGYKVILAERRGTLSEQCNKLRNGLTKLEEAREQVTTAELWDFHPEYFSASPVI